jgi:hypothetical protein
MESSTWRIFPYPFPFLLKLMVRMSLFVQINIRSFSLQCRSSILMEEKKAKLGSQRVNNYDGFGLDNIEALFKAMELE